jgi:hypothetical protein
MMVEVSTQPTAGSRLKKDPLGLARIARDHPVRFFFLWFFLMLGIFHMVDDLFRRVLSWDINPFHEYGYALFMAVGMTLLLPRLPQPMSDEQRRREKEILEQADEVVRQARDEAK